MEGRVGAGTLEGERRGDVSAGLVQPLGTLSSLSGQGSLHASPADSIIFLSFWPRTGSCT